MLHLNNLVLSWPSAFRLATGTDLGLGRIVGIDWVRFDGVPVGRTLGIEADDNLAVSSPG